ncbi:NADP-dependent phosphogluconate dehydrogenase [Intrasporangium calvum]|uniref:6-phosphogluconate dehydrogenase, decarboxylating n=1 Tax=Intrasporangium calvum (strain ATCC 23552 / DSM 43043 / JCM 3097 / NBRC 12989 / NCIMB 10167 / NRRL B-3866 / 7 KIP) TaxID=710696 RepID=E6S742_INTC7|nr:NADP-dependent phosphogluconate dehydrogenase [Intrasporangium calvum]ADU48976.1 6-phosphogluconate dehydrogenase (decarboxylating) [Intrasporangium calvum DSM 43043]
MSTPAQANIGVIGLAVMGSNLARNLARHGHTVAVFNRTHARTLAHLESHRAEGAFVGAETLEEFVAALVRPRRVVIMVQAGPGTDAVIDQLAPLLEEGDIIVDGGNAHFEDTRRREARLREVGLHFVGTGISGGEVGALEGPSIMPGGSPESYAALGPILESIAAQVDGEPCCAHLGPDGAGHFVKMVHNGIEYADMQFIAEAYDVLTAAGLTAPEAADVFREWNTGELDSFLIEITAEVLDQVDAATGRPLVELIVDAAEQKGTGLWTVQTALELGVPVSTIAESVFARSASGDRAVREAARGVLRGPDRELPAVERRQLVDDVRDALWSSKVVAYAQGLEQIRKASDEYHWGVDIATVARLWRGGCIIRARLLKQISDEYAVGRLATLLVAPSIRSGLAERQGAWRRVVAAATTAGVPVPGFSSALAYYDTVRAERLPAALVQGLRDNFGAHTYGRVDRAGAFHTLWSSDRTEVQL